MGNNTAASEAATKKADEPSNTEENEKTEQEETFMSAVEDPEDLENDEEVEEQEKDEGKTTGDDDKTESEKPETAELGLADKKEEAESIPAVPEVNSSTVSEIMIGGVKCQTICDEHFSRIRKYCGIPNDFAPEEEHFKFSKMAAGGGKGGDPMARTEDKKYFIKEINKTDNKTLKELAKDLADHFIEKSEPSVLVPIFFHFTRVDKPGKSFFAMSNCLSGKGPYSKIYDLKGCADDKLLHNKAESVPEVHKRCWNLPIWLGCGGEKRSTYLMGKLEALHKPDLKINKNQKELLMGALKSDCEFLKERNLMDYSLLVGVIEDVDGESIVAENISEVRAGTPLASHDSHGKHRITYVAIIDYLQKWGAGKDVAHAVKFLERNKATIRPKPYADRFVNHFDNVVLVFDDNLHDQMVKRNTIKMPHRCFPFIRD